VVLIRIKLLLRPLPPPRRTSRALSVNGCRRADLHSPKGCHRARDAAASSLFTSTPGRGAQDPHAAPYPPGQDIQCLRPEIEGRQAASQVEISPVLGRALAMLQLVKLAPWTEAPCHPALCTLHYWPCTAKRFFVFLDPTGRPRHRLAGKA
jgi:hypothetical protein